MDHVLLVEADDDFCLFLRQAVADAGCRVTITGSFAEARDALWVTETIDLVITNAMLPDGSGLVLAREAVRLGKSIIVFREGRKHIEVSDWEQPLFRGDRAAVAKFLEQAVLRRHSARPAKNRHRVHETHR